MKVNSQVFRAYDIRGIVNEELSDELVKKLGKAIGTLLIRNNSDALNVCRDGRLSGPHISELFIEGVLSTGCNVCNFRFRPYSFALFFNFQDIN